MTKGAARQKRKIEARERILIPREELKRYRKWKRDIEEGQYQPFFKTHQLNSIGRKHKFFCRRQQRIIHLMSDGEFAFYQSMIWKPEVVAIYEQYALDIHETFSISQRLNIHHPYEYERNVHHIMSTDMLVLTQPQDAVLKHAYSVKYRFDSTTHHRTGQKFEIEKVFWEENRNIPIEPISSIEIDKTRSKNFQFLGMHYDANMQMTLLETFSHQFYHCWLGFKKVPLRQLIERVGASLNLNRIDAEKVFKNAVLRRLISVRAPELIAFHKPVVLAGVN